MNRSVGRRSILIVFGLIILATSAIGLDRLTAQSQDSIAAKQSAAIETRQADWGYWGPNPEVYSSWTSHTNRLIPVYTFGIDLKPVSGKNSLYRDLNKIKKVYGYEPSHTHNPNANYFDQTDVFRLQQMAVESGKKRVILFVYDGMDWNTTRAAAIAKLGRVAYHEGRGTGLHFLDYRGVKTDFGYCVASPQNHGTATDVDLQQVKTLGTGRGGYDARLGGVTPWQAGSDADYLIGKRKVGKHAYTD